MAMPVTLLIMAEDKTHETEQLSLRYEKYGLVEVYPINKIQRQLHTFYTIDVLDTPFASLSAARDFFLEPVFKEIPVVIVNPEDENPEMLRRRRRVIDINEINTSEASSLLTDKHLTITWKRMLRLLKDTLNG